MLVVDDDVSSHIGFGIMFLLFGFHLFLLGAAMWYARKWRITVTNFGCIFLSVVFLWLYLIFVITLPEYFSYSGTSAVFLGFSFIPILYIHYRVDTIRNRVEYKAYMKTMDVEAPKNSNTSDILHAARTTQKRSRCLWFKSSWIDNSHFMYLIYLAILIVYAVLVHHEAKDRNSNLGFINMGVIIVYDIILITWGYFSTDGFYLSPLKVSLVILATRVILCFWPDYWIIIHSIVFLSLLILFMTMWVLKNIHVDSKKNKRARRKKELLEVIAKCPQLNGDIQKETQGLLPEELLPPPQDRCRKMSVELIPIVVLLCTFIVYGIIIWAVDIGDAEAKDINIDNESLNQGIVVGASLAIFASYIPMAIWFRLFQIYQYIVSCSMVFFAICAYALIILIFVVYGAIVLNDTDSQSSITIITVFCIIPLYFFTISIFYGIYTENHYNFYFGAKPKGQVANKNDVNDRNMSEENMILEREKKKGQKTKYTKTPYKCRPSTFNDFVILITFWTNVIALAAAFVLCIVVFDTKWAVAFVYCWSMILEFGAMFALRSYFAGFHWEDRWLWYSSTICAIYFIGSIISFLFGILDEEDGSDGETRMIIACCAIHIGFPLIILYLTVGVKIKESIQEDKCLRVFSVLVFFIAIIVVGVLLIALGKYYASG